LSLELGDGAEPGAIRDRDQNARTVPSDTVIGLIDFVGNSAAHFVLAEEQAQIVGKMPANELARFHFQVAAGELARMPVAPAATLIPEVVEVDRGSRQHGPPQPDRDSGNDEYTHWSFLGPKQSNMVCILLRPQAGRH
jgi:anti-sigma factor RsiW